jgi:calcineurin-like phosphoesterase family protein
MSLYFTSDLHFFHNAQVQRRGFASVAAMHYALIDEWNKVVTPKDTVYLLGDLSFGKFEETLQIIQHLHGSTIWVVPGNHDNAKLLAKLAAALPDKFKILPPLYELKANINRPDGGNDVHRFTLCHFPLLVWNRAHHGAMHLHGHSHGNLQYPGSLQYAQIMDVGVDATHRWTGHWGPIRLETVLECMTGRYYTPLDHHHAANDDDGADARA